MVIITPLFVNKPIHSSSDITSAISCASFAL